MSLLSSIISAIGPSTVLPIIEQVLIGEAAVLGYAGIDRAVTMPSSAIHAVASRTGADANIAENLFKEAAAAEARALVYLASAQDPTPSTPTSNTPALREAVPNPNLSQQLPPDQLPPDQLPPDQLPPDQLPPDQLPPDQAPQ